MADAFKATAPIKLVIWDLDDTFWNGTISEGSIELIQQNIDIVKALVDRGIMSSIASKNDLEPVKKALTEAGVWDYFVFPQVSWNAKGGAIATIIEQANLREDNILFVDDNSLNIEEIRFRFPKMMVAYPQDVLHLLLDMPEAKGKNDAAHSRLKQYKQLEKKVSDQAATSLSNEEFLRQCDIKLRFDYDIDQHLERIIELVNRSNQLNFTKIRLESPEAVETFKANLTRHDIVSAAIFASDRYGSHGLIGFYMQHKNERTNRLLHYVWSCRMMNAGLEQYVYERLGSPEITVVEPVSNKIVTFPKIDWIKEIAAGEEAEIPQDAASLLLIGSCDLTAVSSYCSPNRMEFVNAVKNGVMTRYDDFGFILGDPERVRNSAVLDKTPTWSKEDFATFHDGLPTSEILVVSLSAAMKGAYLLTDDGVVIRVHPGGLGDYIDVNPWADFVRSSRLYGLADPQRDRLLEQSLRFLDAKATGAKHRFLLGANTRDVNGSLSAENYKLLTRYNALCEQFCRDNPGWHFVSINDVVPQEKLLDDRHYTRTGYFDIASYINNTIKAEKEVELSPRIAAVETVDIAAVVQAGKPLSRLTLFGSQQGAVSQVKRAIKLTPLSGVVRKMLVKPKPEDSLVA